MKTRHVYIGHESLWLQIQILVNKNKLTHAAQTGLTLYMNHVYSGYILSKHIHILNQSGRKNKYMSTDEDKDKLRLNNIKGR